MPQGASQTFVISSYPGYLIAEVLVDGQNLGAINSCTFSDVLCNPQIFAFFTQANNTLVAKADPRGSIKPSNTFTVNHGSKIRFNTQSKACYRIGLLVMNRKNHGSVNYCLMYQTGRNRCISAWVGLTTKVPRQDKRREYQYLSEIRQ